jgi:hypothetical protein
MGLTEYLGARRNENAEDRYRNRLSGIAGPKEWLKRADRNEAILNALQEPYFAAQQRASLSGADTLRRVLGDDIDQMGGAPELAASLGLDEVGNKDPRPEVLDKDYRDNAVLLPKRPKRNAPDGGTKGDHQPIKGRDLLEAAVDPIGRLVRHPKYDLKAWTDLFGTERRVDRQDEGWRSRKPEGYNNPFNPGMNPEGVGFDPYGEPGKRITSRSMTNLGDFRLTPDPINNMPGAIASAMHQANTDAWRSFYQQAIQSGMEEAGLSQEAQLAGMAGQPWVQKPIGMSVWGPFIRDLLMKAAQYGMGGIGGGAGAAGAAGGAAGAGGGFNLSSMMNGAGGGFDYSSLMNMAQGQRSAPQQNQDMRPRYGPYQ